MRLSQRRLEAAHGTDGRKEEFAEGVAGVFGCQPSDVRDFYGLVEQVGVVFVDCEAGNKHTPNFAEIAIRDFLTLRQVEPGQSGLIEVFSALPTSYPGQALLTEDIGLFLGYDDCPCGRPGYSFRFLERVTRAEVRGCGDAYAVSQQRGTEHVVVQAQERGGLPRWSLFLDHPTSIGSLRAVRSFSRFAH